MRLARPAVLISVGVLTLFLAAQPASGQQSATGLDQFGTFHRNHIQTMNLFNLNNHIEIPLFTKKERGVNFYAKLVWDQSDSLQFVQVPYPPGGQYFQVNGPRFASVTDVYYKSHLVGSQTCPSNTSAVTTYFDSIVDQDNTVHAIPTGASVTTGQYCGSGTYNVATSDGKWLLTVTWTDQNCWGEGCITSVTETDTSGDVYGYNSGLASLTDPNGNQITVSGAGGSNETWTDPTGNTVFTAQQPTPPQPTMVYSYPVQTGGMAHVQLNYTSGFTLQNQFGCSLPYQNTSASLPTSISLPDGTSYSFVYEAANGSYPSTTVTGRIHSITVPAGGTWTYMYSGGNNGINCTGTPGSPATITITASEGSAWTYNRTVCTSNCSTSPWSQTVVTDPACNDTVYEFDATGNQMQALSYQGTAGTAACSATTKTLLQTVTTCYNGDFTNCGTTPSNGTCANPGGPCRVDTYTYLPGLAQPSLSETFYNGSELVSQQNEFDFGVNTGSAPTTTPLRATMTSYANIGNNILNRPACVQVNGGTSPTTCGTVTSSTKSITKYLSYDSHGNVGTIQEWVSGTTYISRSLTYFSTGLVNTENDFRGTPTTYTYGACNSSYPTQITTAGISQSFTWDCNGGVTTSSKDANSQTTSHTYTNPANGIADPFWRLTQTIYPDGGKFTTTFNDTASPVNVSTTQLIDNSGHSITRQTNFDSLGRPSQTLLTSDPDGTTYTATTYDAFGRTNKMYNPTRCNPPTTNCGESTWGYTTYAYDALGRNTSVTLQDGSVATTSYSGNCTTDNDPAGKARRSCSDVLGRLTQVLEDPTGLNYETDYQYDALDNLLCVAQKGTNSGTFSNCASIPSSWRPRTFAYDSLSRLTRATNPESGAINYTYDNNGNLVTKTAPAPNQTGTATVTLSYCYDALNRPTAKAYTYSPNTPPTCSGTPPTFPSPIATYLYDQSSFNGLAIPNGIGRRTGMTDSAGSEAWSYDSMGRVLSDRRTTNGLTKTTATQSNLAGSIASFTYPSGRTITYSYNGAGRPTSAVDVASSVNWELNAHYAPHGALSSLQDSDGTLVSTYLYNNRLQPCRITTTAGAQPAGCYLFANGGVLAVDLYYYYYAANNGNVAVIANGKDNYLGQTFTYDSLNRIVAGQTNATYATRPGECWGEQFGYDAWGNLLSISAVSSSAYTGCLQENLSVAVSTKNQIIGNTYDAAGNLIIVQPGNFQYVYDAENHLLTAGGVTYTYDGDGKRVIKSGGKLYWYDVGGNVTTVTDLAGSNPDEYIFFNGARHAWRPSNGGTRFFHTDHLGSVRSITYNSGGGSWDAYEYYPFGGQVPIAWVPPNNPDNAYKFTGKERDSESGLDNSGARYYSSSVGRFMSPDPDNAGATIDAPQSWNAYSYVLNNPLNDIDPDGRGDCPDQDPFTCTVTADPTPAPPIVHYSYRVIWENVGRAAGRANDYLHALWNVYRTTRPDPTCLLGWTATGAAFGASKGPVVGGVLGLAGGPAGEVTVPGGAALGMAIGGTAGGIVGNGIGQIACRVGGAGGGASGGGGGPKRSPNFRPTTNPPQPPPDPASVPPGWRVRVGPPSADYPNGYWRLEKPMGNGGWQGIDPSTMKPGTQWETHVPLP